MAPAALQTLLSPAELAYLHTSLSSTPPIRPDARSPTQFRPLIAETDILPGTNGSARICFADGTEAVVGIKAEVEKSTTIGPGVGDGADDDDDDGMTGTQESAGSAGQGGELREGKSGRIGSQDWLEMTIEIPGYRDDDPLPVFLASMLGEALLATGDLVDRLWINKRFHWKLYVDVLLLSPPLSYPVPLLSLTTHLALQSTRLPALASEAEEDPMFNDDWASAGLLFPPSKTQTSSPRSPFTLLVASVGPNILFDPSREELAVADFVLAVSVTKAGSAVKVLSIRTIDPPSRVTVAGVADAKGGAPGPLSEGAQNLVKGQTPPGQDDGVWNPPRGGLPRKLIAKVISSCTAKGGVAEEVLAGLEGFSGG